MCKPILQAIPHPSSYSQGMNASSAPATFSSSVKKYPRGMLHSIAISYPTSHGLGSNCICRVSLIGISLLLKPNWRPHDTEYILPHFLSLTFSHETNFIG